MPIFLPQQGSGTAKPIEFGVFDGIPKTNNQSKKMIGQNKKYICPFSRRQVGAKATIKQLVYRDNTLLKKKGGG